MKILKKILIGFAAFIALLLVTALFVKNEFEVRREITINKPKSEVFAYVRQLKNQDHYSIWVMRDPEMKKEFKGTDGNTGFVYGWNGNDEAGEGEQEITGITEGERVDIEIRFKRPMQSVANTPITTEALSENQTKVSWAMEGSSPYPFNLMSLFCDPMLGPDMETSLANLKNILEKEINNPTAIR